MSRDRRVDGRQDLGFSRKLERVQVVLERIRNEIPPDPPGLSREIRGIVQYIHDHVFEPCLNVNAARASCQIRNNNISTRFRKALGVGIREYIETLRLEAAIKLLQEEQLELYLVAMAVGYCHQETFCRAFGRRFRRTPSELRAFPETES